MTHALEQLAQTAGNTLQQKHLSLATAESCTGGGLSYWITSIPGSSLWFDRGFVTYSNESKIELLGVSKQTLDSCGAVSEDVAREMAAGALRHSNATVSIAITGLAGPDGGTPSKPVGTVWMAWAKRSGEIKTEVQVFSGNRENIRLQTIQFTLERLLTFI